jgi:hypothetical protein
LKARQASRKTPLNTMNVRPFIRLRIPDVSTGGTWQDPTAKEPSWGGIRFPDASIRLKCVKDFGKVEIQQTYAAESVRTLTFEATAQVVVLPNSLIYFDDHLRNDSKGSLEDEDQ